MKARVIKTDDVVTLINKQGDYYLDNNNNPYREDELEFGVIDTTVPTDPMVSLVRMVQGNQQQLLMIPALTFASEVIKAKPNLTAAGIAQYVSIVITKLKKML